MRLMPVREAAQLLGIGRRRVIALVQAGRLPALKVGREWLVEVEADRQRLRGRPVASGNAWGLLALLTGERAEWVQAPVRARLHSYLRAPGRLVDQLSASEARFKLWRLRVLPNDLAPIEEKYHLVCSGLSAAPSGLDVVASPRELDAYIDAALLDELRRRYQPIEDPREANLLLRVPSHPWILSKEKYAPPAVAAADLLHHDDPRVAHAARLLLKKVAGA
ncbi:MAG: helix-turn-helix domain-containing protein [Actinomycetota bacterium]